MRIFGLVIKNRKRYAETVAQVLVEKNEAIVNAFQVGLGKGYKLGYQTGQVAERNKIYIQTYGTPMSQAVREAYQILWKKEVKEGEL